MFFDGRLIHPWLPKGTNLRREQQAPGLHGQLNVHEVPRHQLSTGY
jgi:hypothetical protein